MDVDEFRVRGKEMVDYICQYLKTLPSRRVTPTIEPGYLRKLLPAEAPQLPDQWEDVMDDVESKIMPGVTHWQHPRFHAYFPNGNGFPSILGDMLSGAVGAVGFSWASNPATTELEFIMLDWMAKAIGLPKKFWSGEGGKGGGAIQSSASDCILLAMLTARARAIKRLKKQFPKADDGLLLSKLIAYCSTEAHSCVEKAAMISFVKIRILQPDSHGALRAETLRKAMEQDEQAGRVPFFVSTTLGTTSLCSFDKLPEIAQVVRMFPCVWFHVDAAYAGSSFICPEHRHHLEGIQNANSFNTNPNKFMMTAFDCSLLWVYDKKLLTESLVVDPVYLQHEHEDTTLDLRNWGIPLSRRFRAFKLWFMLRSFGISGIQKYIRLHCELAKYFEQFVRKDERFLVCNQVKLGLVCFRLVGSPNMPIKQLNQLNKELLTNINASGKLHMVPSTLHEHFVIRFCVCAQHATRQDMEAAWDIIKEFATEVLEDQYDQERGREAPRRVRGALAQKRSTFVRMVSDPKIYHPSVSAMPAPKSLLAPPSIAMLRSNQTALSMPLEVEQPKQASWISWPLGHFIDRDSKDDDDDINDMSLELDDPQY